MITFSAVGDLMLGDSEKCIGFGTRSIIEHNGADYPFKITKNTLKADIVFGNLEAVLSEKNYDILCMNSAQMRGSAKAVHGLVNSGFNVLNVANNHIMQHGVECFQETIAILKENNIGIVGLKGNSQFSSLPYKIELYGVLIGFLGYAFEKDAYTNNPLYAQANDHDIINDINYLKSECDIVIVSCHWGDEFIEIPKLGNIILGRKIIQAGANLVIGHHPHVVQQIEKFQGGYIAYSLGNFVTDMAWNKNTLQGLILKAKIFKKDIELSEIVLVTNSEMSQPKIDLDVTSEYKNKMSSSNLVQDENEYENQYFKILNNLRTKNRAKMYLHFFKNWKRIPVPVFFQILKKRLNVFNLFKKNEK